MPPSFQTWVFCNRKYLTMLKETFDNSILRNFPNSQKSITFNEFTSWIYFVSNKRPYSAPFETGIED